MTTARSALTDIALRKLTPPDAGQRDVWDASLPGFGVRVTAKGTKTFFTVYRWQGKWTRISLGRYPQIGLQDARRKAHAVKLELAEGRNPKGEASAEVATFAAVRDEFLKLHVARNNRDRHAEEVARILNGRDLAGWCERPITEIARPDVLRIIDAIMERGSPTSARLTFAVLRKFFNWTVERGYIEESPCAKIRAPHRATSRDRILDPAELRTLWTTAQATPYTFGPIVQLMVLTAQRRSEVAGMMWADLDVARALWTIPAGRTKNAQAHTFQLTPEALRIIDNVPYTNSAFVFPARGKPETCFNGWSKCKRRLDATSGLKDWTLHDIRRTAASGLAELGTPPHVVEKILNHVSGTFGGVAGVYNRFSYLPEMRDALEAWERHLLALEHVELAERP